MNKKNCVACTLLLGISFGMASAQTQSAVQQIDLNAGWQFRAASGSEHVGVAEWHAATVPGEVHTDLQAAGLIADPFFADNEKRLQWVGEQDWEYRTSLHASRALLAHEHLELVFEGLDTFADVLLNGNKLLGADNMFRCWRADVRAQLHEGDNELRVVFHSPYKVMTPVVGKLPYILPGSGYEAFDPAKGIYPVGHYIRTAGYEYGWDWGPKLVTMGIWRPARLIAWNTARITDLHVEQRSVTAERALLTAAVEVEATHAGKAHLDLRLSPAQGEDGEAAHIEQLVDLDAGANQLIVPLRIEHPRRWFPAGYGPQDRYRVVAAIAPAAHAAPFDTREEKIGLRSVELRRQPDQWGTSLAFVINGIPVFAKGANVIPMDSFPGRTTAGRERALLTQARDANMNMIRMWGGGYYQSDSFYEIADELGLMVWQEFAFGGGLVPGDKAFQENVRAEAREQVRRLRDHASVVLWCGNNEVETSWDSWGDRLDFQKSLTPAQRERVWQDYVVLFRDILPSVVAGEGGGAPYWPSSPGANFDERANNSRNGDMHFWDVWSGKASIANYGNVATRFLSEYGFQGMPDPDTVRAFAGSEENFDAPALANHERFIRGFDRMKFYMDAELGAPRDFASFNYLSQFLQAEAIRLEAEHLRATMPRAMGSLYWQLNDCWPVVSWASIDYYGRPKALQYYARRFYAPLLIAPTYGSGKLLVSVVSERQQPLDAKLHLRLMDFRGRLLRDALLPVHVDALAVTQLDAIDLGQIAGFDPASDLAVYELVEDGKIVARNTSYFASVKAQKLPEPKIEVAIEPAEKNRFIVHLQSDTVARAVQVLLPGTDAVFSDNFIDLLPGESVDLSVTSQASLDELRAKLQCKTIATALRRP
jgi:beta-mannosidase